jgi:hypothetical protein
MTFSLYSTYRAWRRDVAAERATSAADKPREAHRNGRKPLLLWD